MRLCSHQSTRLALLLCAGLFNACGTAAEPVADGMLDPMLGAAGMSSAPDGPAQGTSGQPAVGDDVGPAPVASAGAASDGPIAVGQGGMTGAGPSDVAQAGNADGALGGNSATGAAGNPAAAGAPGGPDAALALDPVESLVTAVRYYAGATPAGRTSGPLMGPLVELDVSSTETAAVDVTLELSGPSAQFFQIESPPGGVLQLGPAESSTVGLRIITDDALLPPAPVQDDGATVLEAMLAASTNGAAVVETRLYALVLTYVELEPTFGQILDGFRFTTDVGAALANDANPNVLTGVQAGTDEIAAPVFQRADANLPVRMLPIARFSPPGLVPFGFYTPGNVSQSTVVATLDQVTDPQTNNGSRLLEPPLVGAVVPEFEPGAPFSLFMAPPAGVNPIYGEDAQNADGQHRVKVFVLRDAAGNVVPNSYVIGGEEAMNGDYQDYVFVLSNVTPG